MKKLFFILTLLVAFCTNTVLADDPPIPVEVEIPDLGGNNPRPKTPDLEVEIDCWYQAGCVVASFSDDAGYVDVAVTLNGSTIVSTSVPTAAPAQIYVGTAPGVYHITFTIANLPYTGTWAL